MFSEGWGNENKQINKLKCIKWEKVISALETHTEQRRLKGGGAMRKEGADSLKQSGQEKLAVKVAWVEVWRGEGSSQEESWGSTFQAKGTACEGLLRQELDT